MSHQQSPPEITICETRFIGPARSPEEVPDGPGLYLVVDRLLNTETLVAFGQGPSLRNGFRAIMDRSALAKTCMGEGAFYYLPNDAPCGDREAVFGRLCSLIQPTP